MEITCAMCKKKKATRYIRYMQKNSLRKGDFCDKCAEDIYRRGEVFIDNKLEEQED